MNLQVAVALVDRMKLENGRTQAEQAEFFAKSLHKNWGVGDATCNSGLVLFLSKDDRQVLQHPNLFDQSCSRAAFHRCRCLLQSPAYLVTWTFPADVPRS